MQRYSIVNNEVNHASLRNSGFSDLIGQSWSYAGSGAHGKKSSSFSLRFELQIPVTSSCLAVLH